VESRASDAGVAILRGELIGLMPLDAAVGVTAEALKLDGLARDRIIESHFIERDRSL
jgi:glutamate formiminotransferase